jgi:hypothetical protein
MRPQTSTNTRRRARMGPLLGAQFLAGMTSIWVMILAPNVPFVGMAALWLQLVLPWVLVAYVGFLPNRYTFSAARAVTAVAVPPKSILILVLCNAAFSMAVGVAFTYVEVISEGRLLRLASALALPLLGAMLLVDSRGERSWNWLPILLLTVSSFFYGYWALRWINIVFDRSPQTVACSVVDRKFKGVWVRVQPWGPVKEVKAVQVPHIIYRALEPKDQVCLVTRSGALAIPWYTAQSCPWAGDKVVLGGADLWWLHKVDSRSY